MSPSMARAFTPLMVGLKVVTPLLAMLTAPRLLREAPPRLLKRPPTKRVVRAGFKAMA